MDKMKKNNLDLIKNNKRWVIAGLAVIICLIVIFLLIPHPKSEYEVRFYSDDNSLFLIETVKANTAANPPNQPEISYGNIFVKWDTDFSNVNSDLNIHPVCKSFKGKSNTFAIDSAYCQKDETAILPLSLCGDVKLSGFDITVEYDKESLKLEKVISDDDSVLYNDEKPGKIKINYVSVKNTEADVDVCQFKFKVLTKKAENPVSIKVNKVYAWDKKEKLYVPKHNIIDSTIYVY